MEYSEAVLREIEPLKFEFEGGFYARPIDRGFTLEVDGQESLDEIAYRLLYEASKRSEGWGRVRVSIELLAVEDRGE